MGKRKKPQPQFLERRDIPYSQRMQIRRVQEIQQQRDDAATTALKIALVALNDTDLVMEQGTAKMNYCPNCGARMDGGGNG